jgi:transposase-like protein
LDNGDKSGSVARGGFVVSVSGRKQYTSEQKVAIIKEHLVGKKPASDLCEQYGIAVNMFYRWQEEFFLRSVGVFDKPRTRPAAEARLQRRVEELEERLRRKHEVLSELMEEHLVLKKNSGEI